MFYLEEDKITIQIKFFDQFQTDFNYNSTTRKTFEKASSFDLINQTTRGIAV